MGVEKDIWQILHNASTVDIKDAKTRQEQLDRAKAVNEADVVVVTRCKDCKHWQNSHICQYWSRHGTIETGAYDYCSNGREKG